MKDLQELFESLGADEFHKLSELLEKRSMNPSSIRKILDYISMVYCGEKGIREAEITNEEMEQLIESFTMNIAIYVNIMRGHMEIKAGRMRLTDGECTFSLTKEGVKSVEKMLGKQATNHDNPNHSPQPIQISGYDKATD